MLEVRNLTKIYDNATDEIAGGIRDATFTLQPGDFFTLLGPSGCGKTTTLRCIAGLETPDAARIVLDGRVLFDGGTGEAVPMNKRNLGMVFQSYAIWPHMSVFENVAFPLTVGGRERYSRRQIGQAVADALDTVSLGGYQERPATRLSGGEQQRVALARAIVRKPALLLLDEPLSNLDAQLREEMRGELRQLQRQIGVATLYVTHDQAEALALSDTVAVLDHGRIIQYGTPEDIYFRPRSAFVARFVGATNIVAGTLRAPGVVGALDGRTIACTADDALSAGAAVALCIRPEAITITASGGSTVPPGHNALPGEIRSVAFLGPIIRYDVAVDGTLLQVTASSNARLDSGAAVTLTFPQDKALAVPAD